MHKKILYCAFVFILGIKTNAQINLVPNYSFENYSSCPNNSGQIYLATPWIGTGGAGGVDYYNSCETTFYGVPSQGSLQYQFARTGVAYIGLFTLNGYGGNYREYLQVQLTDSLEFSNCYKVTFYVNCINRMDLATNNMGIYFSDSLYTPTNPWIILPYTPQILPFENKPIKDTVNWIEISGIFISNGGEKYITIGNFFDDASTDTTHTGDSIYNGAYYYIEDVSVLPIDSIPGGMPAYAGVDTNVIVGDSVFIGQQISNLNCNWYNAIGGLIASGTSGIYVSPTTTTTFVVEQELCGNLTYDTVKVSVSVGVDELLNENNVRIYPNPTSGELTIELFNQNNEWLTTILDVQGRTVVEKSFTGTKVNLKLELENGVYLVRVTNKNTNEMVMKKLIIQH